jgi:hypothetical protein
MILETRSLLTIDPNIVAGEAELNYSVQPAEAVARKE